MSRWRFSRCSVGIRSTEEIIPHYFDTATRESVSRLGANDPVSPTLILILFQKWHIIFYAWSWWMKHSCGHLRFKLGFILLSYRIIIVFNCNACDWMSNQMRNETLSLSMPYFFSKGCRKSGDNLFLIENWATKWWWSQ